MDFKVLKDCTALYLAIQALPRCEEATLVEDSVGVSALWLQNMLANQASVSVFNGTVLIGRKPTCHIFLKDRAVSSGHGQIKWSLEVFPCPSTQNAVTNELTATTLHAGDIVRVELEYVDNSTNGSFESDVKIDKGKPFPLVATLCTIPGTTNALDPVRAVENSWSTIYLGRPKCNDGVRPVFAFTLSICIAESFTSGVLTKLDASQLSAFPHNVQRHTFIGCVRDPRLARVKTELTSDLVSVSSAKCNAVNVSGSGGDRAASERRGGATGGSTGSSELEELRVQISQLQSELALSKTDAERTRLEREREARENLSKKDEDNMEIHMLNKKVGTLQSQNAALLAEKQVLQDEAQKLQEFFDRSELKRNQTQSLLEVCESQLSEVQAERYTLSVAVTQNESRNKILENQLREVDRRLFDLDTEYKEKVEQYKQEQAQLVANQRKLVEENEVLRQQYQSAVTLTERAAQKHDQQLKRQIRTLVKMIEHAHLRQMKSFNDLLAMPLPEMAKLDSSLPAVVSSAKVAVPVVASAAAVAAVAPIPLIATAPAPEPKAHLPSWQQTEGPGDDDPCSATDGEVDISEDDPGADLDTDGVVSENETPVQDNSTKRRRRSGEDDMSGAKSEVSRTLSSLESGPAENLLQPNSQFS